MAIVNDGSRSSLSGKVEGLVYVQLNGQTITRRPPRYKKDSETPGMRLNQQRFKQVNAFCALFKDTVITQIWNGMDKRMSGYSLFLKSNMPAFASDGGLAYPKKIQLSIGKLSFPEGFEAHRSEGMENRVEVSWPREMNVGGLHLKDELMLVSECEGQYSDITSTGITKKDLHGSFDLPPGTMPQAPGSMHLYLFFGSYDRRDYSQSVCFEV